MFRGNWWDRRAQAGEGEGGGGSVDPATARTFVQGFVHDPAVLGSMKDDQVMAYHGQIQKTLGEHIQKANETRDWRKELADSEDDLPTLQRFASPKALWQQNKEFRTKLSKGEMKVVAPYPEKGTPEQQTEWRQQNGVPPDGKYELKLPAGMQISEQDQPIVEGFTKFAHEQNMPASEVNKAATWFFGERAKRQEEAAAAYETRKQETAAELGKEWGGDYKPIQNKITGVLDATIPSGEDGEKLKGEIRKAVDTNPMFARMLAAIALQINPTGTLVPGDKGANESTISDELKKIADGRKKDRNAYLRDEKVQERERELLAAYQKVSGKEYGR